MENGRATDWPPRDLVYRVYQAPTMCPPTLAHFHFYPPIQEVEGPIFF